MSSILIELEFASGTGGILTPNNDKILKESLRDCANEILGILERSKISIDNSGQITSLIGDAFPRSDEPVYECFPRMGITEGIRSRELLHEHPIVGPQLDEMIGISESVTMISSGGVLRKFMLTLIDRQNGFQFDEAIFCGLFKDMMVFFRSETLPTQIIFLLENFAYQEDRLTLEDGWCIQKVPEEIKKSIALAKEKPYSALPYSLVYADFALTKEFEANRLVGQEEFEEDSDSQLTGLRREKGSIISALRIMKAGGVICRTEILRSMTWHVGSPDSSNIRWDSRIPIETGSMYELRNIDYGELIDIIQSLKRATENPSFQTSLRRLNYASQRVDFHRQDQILDHMIAFESLLLLRNESELKYRMGLRGATLIGESFENRMEVRDDLGFAYKLRSSIIHGDSEETIDHMFSKRKYTYQSFTERLGDLLRKSMKVYLQEARSRKNHQQIIESLEDRIINDISLKDIDSVSSQNLSNEEILKKLVRLGGTPMTIIELLRKRGLLQDEEIEK